MAARSTHVDWNEDAMQNWPYISPYDISHEKELAASMWIKTIFKLANLIHLDRLADDAIYMPEIWDNDFSTEYSKKLELEPKSLTV